MTAPAATVADVALAAPLISELCDADLAARSAHVRVYRLDALVAEVDR